MYVNLYFGRCYALEVMNFKTFGLLEKCWLFLSYLRCSAALMRAHARQFKIKSFEYSRAKWHVTMSLT